METREALVTHLDGFWRRHRKELLRVDGWPDLRVVRMRAVDNPVEPVAHVTLGLWELTRDRGDGIEVMLLSPGEEAVHVETIGKVVARHAKAPLDAGSVVALGRGWVEGSALDHLLVTLPYPYGDGLERVPDAPIRVLWLVPIHAAEAALAAREGVEALEVRLQRAGIDFLAADRPSVA